ncbi:hypothetical protein K469DRAFT_718867 [Zopfia rhizophila CBS 207.26]|uniref:Uncharacterized protein n=1 Tax=Zopfia rhizophila CBS 207.26 TaxID=1314779 RepID=A0A6A6EPJ7_9PEZI|nr:hypothetical protein K469DRAFT_718867 [Zopfia rhizophila CBS 207.26]
MATPLLHFPISPISTKHHQFPVNGDNYSFNATLFTMMADTSNGTFSLDNLAMLSRSALLPITSRQSNLLFNPTAIIVDYGAPSFLYTLFPSATRNYTPASKPYPPSSAPPKRPPASYSTTQSASRPTG